VARRGIGRFAVYDTSASHAIAWVGLAFVLLGVAGLLVLPSLLLLWVILIGFGAATAPRAMIEWLRERRDKTPPTE
jgi:hypothetical protein